MIAYLKGKLLLKNINHIIIEVNGVGYELTVPLNAFNSLRQGDEMEVITYLHVREDLLQLYGFSSWEEREIFLLLINISGLGPKGAIAILSHISLQQLKAAITREEIDTLTKLPGIGKKTAQRLVIELKDKLTIESLEDESEISLVPNGDSEIISALVALGYQQNEVKKILPGVYQKNPGADEATLIKKALQILSKI